MAGHVAAGHARPLPDGARHRPPVRAYRRPRAPPAARRGRVPGNDSEGASTRGARKGGGGCKRKRRSEQVCRSRRAAAFRRRNPRAEKAHAQLREQDEHAARQNRGRASRHGRRRPLGLMAVSSLEHVDSKETFVNKLREIEHGIRKNGIVCLVVNSNIKEFDKKTGNEILPQFEVCLPTEEMQRIFEKAFSEWTVLKSTVVDQQYDIPRDSGICELKTSVVTFVAKKG